MLIKICGEINKLEPKQKLPPRNFDI